MPGVRSTSRPSGWLLALALVLSCDGPGNEGQATPVEQPPRPATAHDPLLPPTPEPEPASPEPKPPAPAWEPRQEDRITPHLPLENVEALAPFFDRLAALDDGDRSHVRVLHLGDSVIGGDGVTAVIRRKLHQRFGDGGAGFVLLERYMKNYRHGWVRLEGEGWEHCYIAYLCKRDGRYGLGGVTFWSDGGAATTYRTLDEGFGASVAHFELWYLAAPRGGRLEVRVDREEPIVLDTRSDVAEDRYHTIEVTPGPHRFRVRALGRGRTRAYGAVLESPGPGLVWDSSSMLGAFTKRLLGWDPEHIRGQVRQRDPDLLVFSYGGNDLRRVVIKKVTGPEYVDEYVKVIERVRSGKPGVPCLITGTGDHGKILTYDVVPAQTEVIVAAQRETARRAGCAFFDTYAAMGGPGSIYAWRDRSPPLASPDLKHFSHHGHKVVGDWIYDGIMAGYVAHRTGPSVKARSESDG